MQTRLRRSGSVGATARGEMQLDANESLCHAIAAPNTAFSPLRAGAGLGCFASVSRR